MSDVLVLRPALCTVFGMYVVAMALFVVSGGRAFAAEPTIEVQQLRLVVAVSADGDVAAARDMSVPSSSECLTPDMPKNRLVQSIDGDGETQVAQKVLCCCQLSTGGQCCAYVSICFGTVIPGCFC